MRINIRPHALKLQTASRLLRYIGVTGLLVTCSTLVAWSDDKNYAIQLELENCGAYAIDKIHVQKKSDGSSWKNVAEYNINQIWGSDLYNGQSFCVDLSDLTTDDDNPMFSPGDQARFHADIRGGGTENCDGTNYGTSSDGKNRRVMKMKGTTDNNHGCKTVAYKSTRSQQQCSARGEILNSNNC